MTTTEPEDVSPAGRRSDTREVILNKALELFADKGYDATSMREIAEQVGISKPALYYHFDSKEDMVRAIIGDRFTQLDDLISWAREQPPSQGLAAEAIQRWSDIVNLHGAAMFRFAMNSHQIISDVQGGKHAGVMPHLNQLAEVLAPEASVEDQLRIRLAFMSVNMGGFFSGSIKAPEGDVLEAARKVALSLLP